MTRKPYTIFNETRNVRVFVWCKDQQADLEEWDEELWVERGEDWYALMSPQLRDKRVRIIERAEWLRSPLI